MQDSPQNDGRLEGVNDAFVARCLLHLDGALPAEESSELEQMIAASSTMRSAFRAVCELRVALHDACVLADEERRAPAPETLPVLRNDQPASSAPDSTSVISSPFLKLGYVLPLAATLLVAATVLLLPRSPQSARLVASVDASWESDQSAGDGEFLGDGMHSLIKGQVLIAFESGAEAVLNAPCEFSAQGADRISLRQGQLTAVCETPESLGFTVQTPHAEVRDLGTEFGVLVGKARTQVSVFDGVVEMAAGTERHVVVAGLTRAARLVDNAIVVETDEPARFVRRGEFDLLNSKAAGLWSAAEAGFVQDQLHGSQLLMWLDTRPDLPQVIGGTAAVELDPSAAEFGPGRRQNSRALTVTRPGQSLPLRVPGEFDSLTFAAWVSCFPEGSGEQRRGLLMSDGWDQPGEVHWQRKGSDLRISVRLEGGLNDRHLLLNATSPELLREGWQLVVSTIDLRRGVASHYLDGELIDTITFDEAVPPLRIGESRVGGWRHNPQREEDRSLFGAIDQVAVWRRALSAEEVHELYVSTR